MLGHLDWNLLLGYLDGHFEFLWHGGEDVSFHPFVKDGFGRSDLFLARSNQFSQVLCDLFSLRWA